VRVKGYAWVGLATDDLERTVEFFTTVLNLPVQFKHDDVAMLTVGPGQQLEIFSRNHPGSKLTTSPVIAFEVDDMESARQELVDAGVELLGDIGRSDGYAWQYFRSPDGHIFEIKTCPPRA
jgi:catechol 2,3-dioxygenase-like lactoylglutathione lyase family enzyme